MSRYTTIRDYVKARLDTIPNWSFRTIPAGRAFQDRPDSYPGGTWSLDEMAVNEARAYSGTYWRERGVTGYVLLYGTSDGASIGDADAAAWDGVDLVEEAIDGYQVTGLPSGTTIYVLETGKAEPFAIDSMVFGIAIPITTRMQWESTPAQ